MSASIQGGAAAATEGVDVAAARRPGSIRHVALREPTAIAGLAIIAFFVLVAILSPILLTGDPSVISWGRLIENAFNDDAILNNAWWAIIPPGLCVTLVVLGATLFGQSLEDALNPRLRVGHLSVRRFKVRPLRGKLDAE